MQNYKPVLTLKALNLNISIQPCGIFSYSLEIASPYLYVFVLRYCFISLSQMRPKSVYRVSPTEGEIPAERSIEITVTACLDDCARYVSWVNLKSLLILFYIKIFKFQYIYRKNPTVNCWDVMFSYFNEYIDSRDVT